jgi:hypothetical protein
MLQNGAFNLYGYQFVNQEILFLLSLLYTFLYNQHVMQYAIIIWDRTNFYREQKFSKFLLEIMTLVSSTNNVDCDIEFILRGRLFLSLTNNWGHRIGPWGTWCFTVPPVREKILSCIRWFYFNFLSSVI